MRFTCLMVLAGLTFAASASADPCAVAAGRHVVTQNANAVVSVGISVRRPDAESVERAAVYRACWRATGATVTLGRGYLSRAVGEYEETELALFALAGPFVAWSETYDDKYQQWQTSVVVQRIHGRRTVRTIDTTVLGTYDPAMVPAVSELVLDPRGRTAFVIASRYSTDLFRGRGRAARALDHGDRGAISGLTRSGSALHWCNAGVSRSGSLLLERATRAGHEPVHVARLGRATRAPPPRATSWGNTTVDVARWTCGGDLEGAQPR